MATKLAALRYAHPTGSLTAGVLALLIYAVCDGSTLSDAFTLAKACLSSQSHHEEAFSAIELAEQLSKTNLSPEIAIVELDYCWIAEEALTISIYCALISNNFEGGLIMAVKHDSDTDSTRAIVGNLFGALYGVKAIPDKWISFLDLRDIITKLDMIINFRIVF